MDDKILLYRKMYNALIRFLDNKILKRQILCLFQRLQSKGYFFKRKLLSNHRYILSRITFIFFRLEFVRRTFPHMQSSILEVHDITLMSNQKLHKLLVELKETYPKFNIKLSVQRQIIEQQAKKPSIFLNPNQNLRTKKKNQSIVRFPQQIIISNIQIASPSLLKEKPKNSSQKPIFRKEQKECLNFIDTIKISRGSQVKNPSNQTIVPLKGIVSAFLDNEEQISFDSQKMQRQNQQILQCQISLSDSLQNQQSSDSLRNTSSRFYGTQTAIFFKKNSQNQQMSNTKRQDNKIKLVRQKLLNQQENKNITILTENQEISQGILLYQDRKYKQAIQFFQQFLGQLCPLIKVQGINQNKIKVQDIHGDLSLYERRILANLTFYLGNSYFRQKEIQKSINYFLVQINQQEKIQKAHRLNNLGTCQIKLQKHHLGVKKYQQALKLYNLYPQIDKSNLLYNIANLYLNFGMHRQANKYFKSSIEQRKQKSSSNLVLLCRTYYYLALSLKNQKKFEKSIRFLTLAKQITENYRYPDKINFYQKILYEIAILQSIMKNYRKALNSYEKIVQEITKNGENNFKLGQIYEKVSLIFKILNQNQKYDYFKKISLEQYRKGIKGYKQLTKNNKNIKDQKLVKWFNMKDNNSYY